MSKHVKTHNAIHEMKRMQINHGITELIWRGLVKDKCMITRYTAGNNDGSRVYGVRVIVSPKVAKYVILHQYQRV